MFSINIYSVIYVGDNIVLFEQTQKREKCSFNIVLNSCDTCKKSYRSGHARARARGDGACSVRILYLYKSVWRRWRRAYTPWLHRDDRIIIHARILRAHLLIQCIKYIVGPRRHVYNIRAGAEMSVRIKRRARAVPASGSRGFHYFFHRPVRRIRTSFIKGGGVSIIRVQEPRAKRLVKNISGC